MSSAFKPPLGIQPRKYFEKQRLQELKAAINRYFENDLQINIDWIKEYNYLIKRQNKEKTHDKYI